MGKNTLKGVKTAYILSPQNPFLLNLSPPKNKMEILFFDMNNGNINNKQPISVALMNEI
jgi:hypothetical protein